MTEDSDLVVEILWPTSRRFTYVYYHYYFVFITLHANTRTHTHAHSLTHTHYVIHLGVRVRAREYILYCFFTPQWPATARRRHKNRCVCAYPLKSGFCRVPCSTRARPDIIVSYARVRRRSVLHVSRAPVRCRCRCAFRP